MLALCCRARLTPVQLTEPLLLTCASVHNLPPIVKGMPNYQYYYHRPLMRKVGLLLEDFPHSNCHLNAQNTHVSSGIE